MAWYSFSGLRALPPAGKLGFGVLLVVLGGFGLLYGPRSRAVAYRILPAAGLLLTGVGLYELLTRERAE